MAGRAEKRLARAAYTLYFLLNMGYPRSEAVEVTARLHRLTRRERILLGRCVHPKPYAQETLRKTLDPARGLRGVCVAVDAYNQLATIYAALSGDNVYLCNDGLVRDATLGATRQVTMHAAGLSAIAVAALASLSPAKAVFVIDAQPSRSASLAAALNKASKKYGLPSETILAKKADTEMIMQSRTCVAATSDTVIARRAQKILDLARHAISLAGAERAITDIRRLLSAAHSEWCAAAGP